MVGDHNCSHAAHHTDHGSYGQVNVAAGENTQKHAACHDQHITVLQKQIGHVLRIQKASVRQKIKQYKYDDKGDDHTVSGQKFSQMKRCIPLIFFIR